MSSVTSTEGRPGLHTRRAEPGLQTRATPERQNQDDATVDHGFRVWHFFVLTSLVAAQAQVPLAHVEARRAQERAAIGELRHARNYIRTVALYRPL